VRRQTPLLNYKNRIDTGVLLPRGQCNPVSLCEPCNPFGVQSKSAQADSALGLVYVSLRFVQDKIDTGVLLPRGQYNQFRFANSETPLGLDFQPSAAYCKFQNNAEFRVF